ncbi:hypothetical protein KBI23_10980 [bacterium]|nr:hypothetical protein [bacterium]MBP9809387.1 hypothetical protein [bacterium]
MSITSNSKFNDARRYVSALACLAIITPLVAPAAIANRLMERQGLSRPVENPGDIVKEQEALLPGQAPEVSPMRQRIQPLPKAGETNDLLVKKGTTTPLLKAEVTYCVPKGTGIKLKLSAVPTQGMHLLDRDMDGKLHPAHVGDIITASTSEDIYVEDNKVIPAGTVFKGRVSAVKDPRRVQRPGWLEISFTELALPNGKRFAFSAEANNFKKATLKGVAKGTGMVAANAAGGAIVGALAAYQIVGGMRGSAACHYYNIAGGAAAGALIAAGHAIMKRGERATLEPGDDLNLSIDTDLLLPALAEPTKKVANMNLDGLSIEVGKTKVIKDGLDGHFIRMDVTIDNNSDRKLSAIDLYLRDTNGNKYPVGMGPGDDSEFLFTLEPYSSLQTKLFFATEYPKLKHELIWIDHRTRKVCFRQKLE